MFISSTADFTECRRMRLASPQTVIFTEDRDGILRLVAHLRYESVVRRGNFVIIFNFLVYLGCLGGVESFTNAAPILWAVLVVFAVMKIPSMP